MSTNDEDAIATFMSITGASEAAAVHKLEEHHGNLNAAINAYFNDNDRNRNQETSTDPVDDDAMDIDSPTPPNWPPSSTSPFDGAHAIEDVSESARDHDDNNMRNMSAAPFTHTGEHGSVSTGPSARPIIDVPDYNNDIEEEMVQAAIEASKRDAAVSSQGQQYDDLDLGDPNARSVQSHHEDPELDHAVSLSLKSADQGKELRELEGKVGDSETETHESATPEEMGRMTSSNTRFPPLDVGSSSVQHEAEELPQLRNQRRQLSSNPTTDPEEFGVSPPSSPRQHGNDHPTQHQGSEFPSEWGGISSEEHDEAVMLEAAMFGGIPEGSGYHFPYATYRPMQNGYYPRHDPRPPSPSLTAQRLLREQQDDEYLSALQADREKELKAMEEAEDALAEERRKGEELRRREQEEQEIERQLAAKGASLPPEPSKDDENVVTLLVRMPDGSRRGRRFLKSDQLQHIFDFIDIGRGVKPGSYRLVRPYPRRAFSEEERTSVLNELGLTSKQEALYLELI